MFITDMFRKIQLIAVSNDSRVTLDHTKIGVDIKQHLFKREKTNIVNW